MNVFRHEFRWGLQSACVWAAALSLTGLFMVSLFPAFEKDVQPLLSLLRNYPEPILRAMGLNESVLNSFNGFYSFLVSYVLLCAIVQALGAGVACISKEGARHTTDFLFTRTRSRLSILCAKYLSALCLTLIVGGAYALVTFAGAKALVHPLDARMFFLINGAFLLTQMLSTAIGFCVGCFARRIKSPGAVAMGLGALSFAVLLLSNMTGDQAIALLSPMGYLNSWDVLALEGYDALRLTGLIVLTAAFLGAGAWRYVTKDLS